METEEYQQLMTEFSTVLQIDVEMHNIRNGCYVQIANGNVQPENIIFGDLDRFDKNEQRFIILTDEELNTIEYPFDTITLIFNSQSVNYEHAYNSNSTDGFTVRRLFDIVLDFENQTRPLTCFLGGIDVHHIYFEGLRKMEDGKYRVMWGS